MSFIRSFIPLYGWRAALVTVVTQFLSSYLVNLLPYSTLYRLYPLFRQRKWESEGNIYQKLFHIRAWKDYVPAVGSFDKKHINAHPDRGYLSEYLLESLRAELCHGLTLVLSLFIMAISSYPAKGKILLWALSLNMPCIMIQRFNRPRFERLLSIPGGEVKLETFWKDQKSRKKRNDDEKCDGPFA